MSRTRFTLVFLVVSALLTSLLTAALAQGQPFEAPSHDVRFQYPQGWLVTEQVDASGLLTVQLSHPTGGGIIVVAAAVITPADRAYWSSPGPALLEDVWGGFLPEVPGAQDLQRYEITVAQLPGHVLDYASDQLAGTIVVFVGPVAAFTLISAADRERIGDVQNALELVAGSFSPPSMAGADLLTRPEATTPPDTHTNPLDPPPGGGTPGTNPLDPPGGTNPLDAPPATNPLDPTGAQPANPLDPTGAQPANPLDGAAPGSVDPYLGRFADPDVTLVLQAAQGGYVGEMVVLGAPHPVSATLVDGRLDGSFGAGEQRFAFTAELDGDTLTLDSDGARFVLQRRP